MRLLLFSDLHVDSPFTWAPPELARIRRRALRDALTRICNLVPTLSADALCCGGDLFEQERFTPDTANFLRDCFARLDPTPVFLAPGNHDWLGPASLYRLVEWSPNVHLFQEPTLAPITLVDGLTLWGAAHCAPANTPGFLDHFSVDRDGVHLALFHGSEMGDFALQENRKVPHAPFRAAQIPTAGLHHAMLGHFHAPRDAVHHTYPGNPEPLAFGETGERAAVLITVGPDGTVRRQRHPVAVSRVSDVLVSLDGVTHSGEVRQRLTRALSQATGIVRATLAGEVHPDVDLNLDDLVDAGAHLQALVPRWGRVTVAYDFDELAEERTVRGQFVRDVREAADLTEDARRRVLITGLRALEGRSDLEVH